MPEYEDEIRMPFVLQVRLPHPLKSGLSHRRRNVNHPAHGWHGNAPRKSPNKPLESEPGLQSRSPITSEPLPPPPAPTIPLIPGTNIPNRGLPEAQAYKAEPKPFVPSIRMETEVPIPDPNIDPRGEIITIPQDIIDPANDLTYYVPIKI